MKKLTLLASVCALLVALGGVVWYLARSGHVSFLESKSVLPSATAPAAQQPVPPLTQTYKSDTFRLSFKYPEGYSVREVSGEGTVSILIENPKDGKGIQIQVSDYTDTDTSITVERLSVDVPDMVVEEPQPINLSAGGGTGLAFESDNPDFGGSSREAWFVVAGRLYQVSTYTQYDEVLKAVFSTWSFN